MEKGKGWEGEKKREGEESKGGTLPPDL